jgi:hypothetical protein
MNSSPHLNKLQNSIIVLLFEHAKLRDPATPLEFTLSGDFGGQFNAVIGDLEDVDEASFLVATLPRYTSTVFVALTRSREREVAKILANLEDLERENAKPLRVGAVISHPGSAAASEFPPNATLLMPVNISGVLSSIPPVAALAGQEIRFVMALPLSQKELERRNTQGHDAMIDMFEQDGKSLFFA